MYKEVQSSEDQDKFSLSSIVDIPIKIILASTLIIVDIFRFSAKSREISQIIKNIRENHKADENTRRQLLNYLNAFQNPENMLCPIMIRQAKTSATFAEESEKDVYKVGIIMNGKYEWSQALKIIRTHLSVQPNVSLCFFYNKTVISNGLVANSYKQYKSQDGILYLQYAKLQSFG